MFLRANARGGLTSLARFGRGSSVHAQEKLD